MDPIEVLDICRIAAHKGMPKDVPQPRIFNVGDYEQLWSREPKKVREILDDLLCGPNVADGLEMLLRFDFFTAVIPELRNLKGMGDEGGLHKDVWEHTKAVVAGTRPEVDIRWGALMHDIGKVPTRRMIKGKVTFHNHDIVGARMLERLNNRMNLFQNDVALFRTVRYLVLEHLRPAGYNPEWTDSAVRRLITECGDTQFFDKLMNLSRADLTTKNSNKRSRAVKRADELERRANEIRERDNAPKLPKGTMGFIIERSGRPAGAWTPFIRERLEVMMKEGHLELAREPEYYVIEGLKLVEEMQ